MIAFESDVETPALLGGAAAAVLILAIAVAILRPGPAARISANPDASLATAWTAVSLTLLALSPIAGFWLTLIAAGMLVVGIGGLTRELSAQRQALRRGGGDERD